MDGIKDTQKTDITAQKPELGKVDIQKAKLDKLVSECKQKHISAQHYAKLTIDEKRALENQTDMEETRKMFPKEVILPQQWVEGNGL